MLHTSGGVHNGGTARRAAAGGGGRQRLCPCRAHYRTLHSLWMESREQGSAQSWATRGMGAC